MPEQLEFTWALITFGRNSRRRKRRLPRHGDASNAAQTNAIKVPQPDDIPAVIRVRAEAAKMRLVERFLNRSV